MLQSRTSVSPVVDDAFLQSPQGRAELVHSQDASCMCLRSASSFLCDVCLQVIQANTSSSIL